MAAPVDAARQPTLGSTAADPATFACPATVNAGDVLLYVFRATNNTISTLPGGFTTLFSAGLLGTEGISDTMAIGWKSAAGTEGGTNLSIDMLSSTKYAAIVWRITGAGTPQISTHAFSSAGSTTPDPNSFSPVGGSNEYLWLWVGGWQGEQTSPPTGNPTNYSNPVGADSGTGGAVTTNVRVAGASRQNTTATENPPSWTISVSDQWSAWTIAIPPAAPPPAVPNLAGNRQRTAHRFLTQR